MFHGKIKIIFTDNDFHILPILTATDTRNVALQGSFFLYEVPTLSIYVFLSLLALHL